MNAATTTQLFGPDAMAVGFAEALLERSREQRRHLVAVGGPVRESKKQAASATPKSLWRYAGQRIGPVLLAAKNANELEAALEAVVESSEFQAIQSLWQKEWESAPELCADCPLAKEPRERAKVPPRLRAKYELLLGRKATEFVDEARWYGPAICSAVAKLEQATGKTTGISTTSAGLDFLTRAPIEQARAMLSGLKGTAAHYAISHAIDEKQRLPRWLAESLARAYRDGSREYLRLLASDPRARVSENMIPVGERIDLDAMRAEAAELNGALAALAAKRREAGKRIVTIREA
jgi:hypothetical protein